MLETHEATRLFEVYKGQLWEGAYNTLCKECILQAKLFAASNNVITWMGGRTENVIYPYITPTTQNRLFIVDRGNPFLGKIQIEDKLTGDTLFYPCEYNDIPTIRKSYAGMGCVPFETIEVVEESYYIRKSAYMGDGSDIVGSLVAQRYSLLAPAKAVGRTLGILLLRIDLYKQGGARMVPIPTDAAKEFMQKIVDAFAKNIYPELKNYSEFDFFEALQPTT